MTSATSTFGPRAAFAAFTGGNLARLSRAAGKGSGAVIGGHAILAIEPRALQVFSKGRRVVLVSGTNGKTTTTKLLAQALSVACGQPVVTNSTGANLPTGLVSTLAASHRRAPAKGSRPPFAVLEVDEAWLDRVSAEVEPALVLLLNLSRDQLDRNNEVRQVARRWREACGALSPGARVVANADDPLVAWAASAAAQAAVTWVAPGLRWAQDAMGCPECASAMTFAGEARSWRCSGCGFARPEPDAWLEPGAGGSYRARLRDGRAYPLQVALPGRCNQGNALAALAAVLALGVEDEHVDAALHAVGEVTEVGGRYATFRHNGAEARLLLAKNPGGWSEIFDMLSSAPDPVVVAINARTADGHDPSWLWDVPFEQLAGRRVIATGERRLDLAVRLAYAGVDHEVQGDLALALRSAGGPVKAGGASGRVVDVVANYTAFHQLLAHLEHK